MLNYKDKSSQDNAKSASYRPVDKSIGLTDHRPASVVQQKLMHQLASQKDNELPIQKKTNQTGLPNHLKSGIENLSGHSMDDVKVHYNSSQPAQLNAHAYAQGSQIHIAPGQEKHLPHEAWHVVQQKQGRVRPTTQLKGKININADKALEKEADVMGATASTLKYHPLPAKLYQTKTWGSVYQAALTPAQKLLNAHGPHHEDNVHALIGSDNDGESLIRAELEECIKLGMTLPATLSSHLKNGEWDQTKNDEWIKLMVADKRVFVVAHGLILDALIDGDFEAAYDKQARKKRVRELGGTWKEVLTLLKSGYIFEQRSQVLLLPKVAEKYEIEINRRLEGNAKH